MTAKNCQICGKPSGIYPLCPEHFKMRDEGQVIKNEKTGLWEVVNNKKSIEYQNESGICCVCGNKAPKGKQCLECYSETLEYKDSIEKDNRNASDMREYYYSLKYNISRIARRRNKKSNCNKLIALALINKEVFRDNSLITRVYDDISELLQKNKNKEDDKDETQTLKNYNEQKNERPGQVKCVDGHWVESDLEKKVDDILYYLGKRHIYAKRVNQILGRIVKCDWFIPVIDDSKGIFIELWGMDTEEYKKNQKEKIQLYKEEELPLIQIYKEDLKDTTLLKDNLERDINELEKQIKRKK